MQNIYIIFVTFYVHVFSWYLSKRRVEIAFEFAHSVFQVITIYFNLDHDYYIFKLWDEKNIAFDIMFYIHGEEILEMSPRPPISTESQQETEVNFMSFVHHYMCFKI